VEEQIVTYSVEQLIEMLEKVELPTAKVVGFGDDFIDVYEADVLEGVFKLDTSLKVTPDWHLAPLTDEVYAVMMEVLFESVAKIIFNKDKEQT